MTTLDTPTPKREGKPSHQRCGPEVAIKEARRRQRRRWMVAGAVVLMVALCASIAFVEVGGDGDPSMNASTHPRSHSEGHIVGGLTYAPDACGLLSNTEATQLLGSPTSGQAFTDLGFPISSRAAPNPTYSQCRFTSATSQNQITLIVNASPSKAPNLSIQAVSARVDGGQVLTIDGVTAVWLPWVQADLHGQGGQLSSVKDGNYVAVVLIYVHDDPLGVAEDAMRTVLPRI